MMTEPGTNGRRVLRLAAAVCLAASAHALAGPVERAHGIDEILAAGAEDAVEIEDEAVAAKIVEELIDELIDLIVSTIEPGRWAGYAPQHDAGGDLALHRIRAGDGELLITAPEAVHDRIEGLFNQVRQVRLTRIHAAVRVLTLEQGDAANRWRAKLAEGFAGAGMTGSALSDDEVDRLLGAAAVADEMEISVGNALSSTLRVGVQGVEIVMTAHADHSRVRVALSPRAIPRAEGENRPPVTPPIHTVEVEVPRINATVGNGGTLLFGGFARAPESDPDDREWLLLVTPAVVPPELDDQ